MKIVRGLGSIAAIAGVTASVWLTGQLMANAAPGEGEYQVQCDVYSNSGFGGPFGGGGGMPVGQVIGIGSDEGEAMQDAQRKMWSYMNPYLSNCHPI
ncbi:hypothetical protein [Segniliparus rugosus]|uniref:Uncharacterized protein n=1 Tax=Segniliparus rugosus (strain ATCC BAA-974 / DSM 45345 / CCUG 50838 / CIP 108380 / JCM 13579 / CDC 945) TaxID=679197 RepID=E5XL53_SEGRC|nr:hypothetical protein [Segniliparus rugosus]EFV14921.1 hypothetical protein HMPREF9336_00222 [Segniliparus rugosus ATCC BAA-974]